MLKSRQEQPLNPKIAIKTLYKEKKAIIKKLYANHCKIWLRLKEIFL